MKGIGFIFLIWVLILSGWVMNIVKLTKCNFEAPYKAEVIRVVGIIPPVGMVVGWMNFKDGE